MARRRPQTQTPRKRVSGAVDIPGWVLAPVAYAGPDPRQLLYSDGDMELHRQLREARAAKEAREAEQIQWLEENAAKVTAEDLHAERRRRFPVTYLEPIDPWKDLG